MPLRKRLVTVHRDEVETSAEGFDKERRDLVRGGDGLTRDDLDGLKLSLGVDRWKRC